MVIETATTSNIDVTLAVYIAQNESSFIATSTGDMTITCHAKSSPFYLQPVRARGIFQLTACYHFEVSDTDAYDPVANIKAAMSLLKDKKTCLAQFTTCGWYYYGKPKQ